MSLDDIRRQYKGECFALRVAYHNNDLATQGRIARKLKVLKFKAKKLAEAA